MKNYKLAESELRFAKLIWEHEPIGSGKLVRLCEKEMDWKKSTTYTVLKKLCLKGVFQNKNAMVSSLVTEKQYQSNQSVHFVEDTFGGSLPKFLTAFIGGETLSHSEAEKLKKFIDEYREGQ